MNFKFGILQGRLSEAPNGRLQYYPKDHNSEFKIAKNTLSKLAAEKSSKAILSEEITGPLGFVLSNVGTRGSHL